VKRLRLYADTSVFGGCFDEEFADVSRKLLEEIRRGRFVLVVSETTLRELQRAPEEIRQVIAGLPDEAVEAMTLTDEVERLRPLVELGGYLPCPDHRIAPDAKWKNVQYYCQRMRETFG